MKGHPARLLVENQELVRKRKDSEVGSILKMKGVESFSKVEISGRGQKVWNSRKG